MVSDDTSDQEDTMPLPNGETGKAQRRAQEQYKLIAKSQAKTGDNTVRAGKK